jgi:uncharacterized integral membrane protein (TIGR00698 family)
MCLAAVEISHISVGVESASPLTSWLAKPGSWEANPLTAWPSAASAWGCLGVFLVGLAGFGLGQKMMGHNGRHFLAGFLLLFGLATLAYVMAGQMLVRQYNLEYVLWALLLGLCISNTIGSPRWLRAALCTEFYIKTGLVLLGAEILLSRLLALGLPGVCVAWIVTPVVLVTTYWFGQRILRIRSPSLNMVISADMSVCGVSAAIATAAACRARKEELTLAIGLSLSFTVVMMVLMPAVIRAAGMDSILAGAWIGGTIDATGAVAAAGAILGDDALQVAATVKMIQNILIGVIAFAVAVYWVTRVDRGADGPRPGWREVWIRFPKFILGFVAASAVFSLLYQTVDGGQRIVADTIAGTKVLRGWFFCLAFVSIGLETRFAELAQHLRGGKPLALYVVGQSLNLCLTLVMAWLMFTKVFPQAAEALRAGT